MKIKEETPIFILGYMGAGKSTLGLKLAKFLNRKFIDTDLFLENRFRTSISKMFEEIGEERFRNRERVVIEEIVSYPNSVIATGGGLPCFFDNIDLMNRNGITIYLEYSAEELLERLSLCKRDRPLLKGLEGSTLLEKIKRDMSIREVYYKKAQIILPCYLIKTREDETILAERIASNFY